MMIILLFDVTGSICKRIKYEHNKKAYLFMFVHDCNIKWQYADISMLSAEQDIVVIKTWL